ncbi:hypothetical protein BDZ89DRAFT_436625 [Hymenopellis radicata]|nr:hypothetical protein BDZ89DRAFT_436625 [Hymenopellis radicata]
MKDPPSVRGAVYETRSVPIWLRACGARLPVFPFSVLAAVIFRTQVDRFVGAVWAGGVYETRLYFQLGGRLGPTLDKTLGGYTSAPSVRRALFRLHDVHNQRGGRSPCVHIRLDLANISLDLERPIGWSRFSDTLAGCGRRGSRIRLHGLLHQYGFRSYNTEARQRSAAFLYCTLTSHAKWPWICADTEFLPRLSSHWPDFLGHGSL